MDALVLTPGASMFYLSGFEHGHAAERLLALIVRRWHWEEDGSEAGADEMAWAFELRDHRILSWRPLEDRAEALRAYHRS